MGQLEDRYSVVFGEIFRHGDRRLATVAKRMMKLVDCMWDVDQRDRVIQHRIPDNELMNFFKKLSVECAHLCWYVKTLRDYEKDNSKLPKKATPSRVTTQMQGMSNNLGNFDLDPYEPIWRDGGRMESQTHLSQVMDQMKRRLQDLCEQRDRNERIRNNRRI